MRTNKFSIDGLHVSSIVNEAINTISIFFYEKILNAQNRKSTQNQLQNKIKRTKNNKGNNFSRRKTSKSQEIGYFVFH